MAYTLEQIRKKLQEVIEVVKPVLRGGIKRDLPEYYDGYKKIVNQYNRIRTHADYGYFPKDLFVNRSPNESDEEFDYRKKNYKQITRPVFLDYLNTRGRAWHNSNWSIDYQEENKKYDNNTFRNYVENEVYLYGSIENFVINIMPALKTKDPNGVIVVKPYKYDYKETINEDGSIGYVLSDLDLLNPIPYYYSCEQVVSYSEENHCLIELSEKSYVEYQGQKQKIGIIYEFHDENNIYIITQTGKFTEFQFDVQLELKHEWGQMLVTKLMGIPCLYNNEMFYESPFSFAVDNLDLVLLDSSNLFASKAKCVYPYRVMMGVECDFSDGENRCVDGKVFISENGIAIEKTCKKCNGTGLKNRVSPLGEILWNPKEKDNSVGDMLKYISPEVSSLDLLIKEINSNEAKARRILHLNTTSDEVNGREDITATSKAIENKALMAFVKSISDQEFDLYEWILDAIGYIRYGNDYVKPNIIRPITYDFTTEKDYIELLEMAVNSGCPPIVVRQIIMKYLTTIYFTDKESSKAFTLLLNTDRVLELSKDEINIRVAQGYVSKEEVIIHDSGISLIHDLYINNPNFFDLDFIEQEKLLFEKAKEKANELKSNEDNVQDVI